MEATYDQWAEIYDSVYSYVRDDIPFYLEEAVQSGGPVLELGCGTGRVTIPIARAGVDIIGLDFSEAMLEVARRKSANLKQGSGRLTLVHANMRDFSLPDEKFSLAIIPFRGFLSLLTVEDEIKTLLNIQRHLAPHGKLILSIFVPDPHMLAQDGDVPYHFRDVADPDTGREFIIWQQTNIDNPNQILYVRLVIEELGEGRAVTRKIYRDFQLRYVHRWEMHHLLQLCGFHILNLYGDFERNPFDESSSEMVWEAGLRG
ncbi:MAG: class I SAM-dependent methyltransferase [Chloroflexi bacterium]|nr:class I SAM-dependent methyltransferase [Chloroflexota bacterium]